MSEMELINTQEGEITLFNPIYKKDKKGILRFGQARVINDLKCSDLVPLLQEIIDKGYDSTVPISIDTYPHDGVVTVNKVQVKYIGGVPLEIILNKEEEV